MNGRILTSLFLLVSLCTSETFCQESVDVVTPTEEVTDAANEALFAFVSLGYFSDRGILSSHFQEAMSPHLRGEPESKSTVEIPSEVLELLKTREQNLSQEFPKLSLLFESKDHTPKASLVRFRTHGLIELFQNENANLLDSPLSQRKELMKQYEALVHDFATTVAALFAKGLSDAQLVTIIGALRRLSVELDFAILASLSPDERVRISKVVSYVMPSALASSEESCRKFAFGSYLFDVCRNSGPKPQKK